VGPGILVLDRLARRLVTPAVLTGVVSKTRLRIEVGSQLGPVLGALGRAPDRAQRVALGALDIGRVGTPSSLQVEVLPDRII